MNSHTGNASNTSHTSHTRHTRNARQTQAASVITVEQARREGVSPRSLMMVAEWNDKRGRTLRHKAQAVELRHVAAQLAASNDNRAGRRAA